MDNELLNFSINIFVYNFARMSLDLLDENQFKSRYSYLEKQLKLPVRAILLTALLTQLKLMDKKSITNVTLIEFTN